MRLRRAADQFWPVRVVAGVLGAAAVAATSGIVGALTEAGLSKEDAHSYAEGVRRGGTLVSTRVPDGDRVRPGAVLNRSAVNLRDRTAAWQKSGWKTFDPASKPYGAGLDFADQDRKPTTVHAPPSGALLFPPEPRTLSRGDALL